MLSRRASTTSHPARAAQDARAPKILARALHRAAENLGMAQGDIAKTIGVSDTSVSRLFSVLVPYSFYNELYLLCQYSLMISQTPYGGVRVPAVRSVPLSNSLEVRQRARGDERGKDESYGRMAALSPETGTVLFTHKK